MYINPFLAGVLFTIGFELLIVVVLGVTSTINNKEVK